MNPDNLLSYLMIFFVVFFYYCTKSDFNYISSQMVNLYSQNNSILKSLKSLESIECQ